MKAWVPALALIIASNGMALGNAFYNRQGEPSSSLTLTERELHFPYLFELNDADSGTYLTLNWSVFSAENKFSSNRWSGVPWLTREKLVELGLTNLDVGTVNADPRRRAHRRLPNISAFIVFELNGPTYQLYLENFPNDKAELINKSSRLFAIDAGLDAKLLRAKYPDKSVYLICRGQIRPNWTYQANLIGYIEEINVKAITVPARFRQTLDRFEAQVNFGRRFEPWIAALKVVR